jgi:ribonuclease P protein component
VLARTNRVVRADDYRNAVRRGHKVGAHNTVTYVLDRNDGVAVRFGFIVAKTVGNAVMRNRVRRRLKAASYELLGSVRPGMDLVIRALPSSAGASWASLRSEVMNIVARAEARNTEARR